MEMHPDIKRFWVDAGYEILYSAYKLLPTFWYAYKPEAISILIAILGEGYDGEGYDYYYFNHKSYSESEMLRILKLKAFL